MPRYDEENLGEILSALPPAPESWVKAAQDIPLAQRGLDEIVERADADDDYRRRVIEDPEAAPGGGRRGRARRDDRDPAPPTRQVIERWDRLILSPCA